MSIGIRPAAVHAPLSRAAHRALAQLTVLALLLSIPPVGGDENGAAAGEQIRAWRAALREEDGAAAGERIRAWRAALRVAEWRDLHYLAVFRSPHEWVRDPKNCTHSSRFGPDAEYIPGCAHGYRYSALGVTSAPALCAELAAHGVRKVTMVGDSFMRHLYVAFVTLLREDWAAGALIPNHDPECRHRGQYTEKVCRSQINGRNVVCRGAVKVQLIYNSLEVPKEQELRDQDVVLWSFGMHPMNHNYPPNKVGAETSMGFVAPQCRAWKTPPNKVVWLSMHAGYRTPESKREFAERNSNSWRRAFNQRMQSRLREECGVREFVDLLQPTAKAIFQVPRVHDLTYDGQHWGPEFNLAKLLIVWPHLLAAADAGQDRPAVGRIGRRLAG